VLDQVLNKSRVKVLLLTSQVLSGFPPTSDSDRRFAALTLKPMETRDAALLLVELTERTLKNNELLRLVATDSPAAPELAPQSSEKLRAPSGELKEQLRERHTMERSTSSDAMALSPAKLAPPPPLSPTALAWMQNAIEMLKEAPSTLDEVSKATGGPEGQDAVSELQKALSGALLALGGPKTPPANRQTSSFRKSRNSQSSDSGNLVSRRNSQANDLRRSSDASSRNASQRDSFRERNNRSWSKNLADAAPDDDRTQYDDSYRYGDSSDFFADAN